METEGKVKSSVDQRPEVCDLERGCPKEKGELHSSLY